MSEAIPLLNSILHTATQAVCAMGVGVLVDRAAMRFSYATGLDKKVTKWNDAVLSMVEVGAQILVSSLVLGLVYNYLAQLPADAADPTSGFVFAYFLFNQQRGLRARLNSLLEYGEDRIFSAEDSLMNGANSKNNIASPATQSAQGQRILNGNLRSASAVHHPRNAKMSALKTPPRPASNLTILGY